MTERLPFTKARLRRAIAAARAEGLKVKGIRPDGTIVVEDGDNEAPSVVERENKSSKWVSAKQ